ncbi:MAG: class I SAM-dependent methyltransferase, partial [Candidatus Kariarchaeaceae archaeon]|jgi:ubiquinone/menaquinone biosynthesis C-methylase UbiE
LKCHHNNHYCLKINFVFLTINNLRDTYNVISESYHTKKSEAWTDLISSVPELKQDSPGYLINVGAGNGRNLKFVSRTLVIALDIADNLLRNYVADLAHQRVAASATQVPIRKMAANEVFSIAVIHHLENEEQRVKAIKEFYRINIQQGKTIITVWRKWRKEIKEKLMTRIRTGESINDLVNHHRPWKNSSGKTLGIRFYHYYSWKELYFQVNKSKFTIQERKIMGGKYKDGNFLVKLLKT